MPRGRSYHHGDLRSALIAAAGEMLERDGPEAISFRAVARATGVSQTAPYNHFQSKEDLLATVAEAGFRDLEASQSATAEAARPGEDRVTALGLDYVRFALRRPQLYRLMFGVGVSDWYAHPEVLAAKGASFRPIQTVLAEQLAAGGEAGPEAVETAAIAAWALVHGLAMLLIDRSLDPAKKAAGQAEALVTRVVGLVASGLKPGSAKP
ncbi:TetR/AcrR family transcriptional regulator [Roseomonas hellenica]|uniref:TetR/AcrR family transcriptional regulator n=1 Tax=Plastoroseomonas hellenica TaxID=2687306 RepID=A0ABS5F1R4_9PROT|nr:TetR/AcrR family transcriptional regulator [Plastoroseomonas hellenica]